jgi:hypothetical protein
MSKTEGGFVEKTHLKNMKLSKLLVRKLLQKMIYFDKVCFFTLIKYVMF